MTRARRAVAMVTATLAMVLLGFVVAAASRSLPGTDGDEPWIDFRLRADIDVSEILAWVILALALIGAVLFALGLRQVKPREDPRRRNMLGLLIALALFVVAYRFLRPAAQAFFSESASSGQDAVGDAASSTSSAGGAWLFAVLLAAVIAVVLTRIGLSIRTVPAPFFSGDGGEMLPIAPSPTSQPPTTRMLGQDPRARILHSYGEFEQSLASHGKPRLETETETNHVRRASRSWRFDKSHLDRLLRHQLAARFGPIEPIEGDASEAEESSRRLIEELGD